MINIKNSKCAITLTVFTISSNYREEFTRLGQPEWARFKRFFNWRAKFTRLILSEKVFLRAKCRLQGRFSPQRFYRPPPTAAFWPGGNRDKNVFGFIQSH